MTRAAFVIGPSRNPIVQAAWAGLDAADKAGKKAEKKAAPAMAHPKENPAASSTYIARVRQLACRRCGYKPKKGNNQFCHGDQGKGLGLKTDVREGWSGCGPHDGEPGCHWLVGTSGKLPKAERRRVELEYAASTRTEIQQKGLWPKKLPLYPGMKGAPVSTAKPATKKGAKK